MKTLINKNNPAIRITAPEIITAHPPVSNEGYVYWIPAINEMYSPIDWTLVEEPKKKKNCSDCPHCVDRKDQNGWHFKGCFGGPYKGKFIAEIDECPLVEEEPKHTEVWVEGRTFFEQEEEPTEDWREKRKEECPFRKADGCERYAGVISECTGNCSWVVDYPKLKEIQDKQEQKPAEWSEEDLQHKSWILECLAGGERKMPEYAEDFRAAYKWLKSLRPSWKPSEEQMEELNKVRTLNPGLDALYQQLKNMQNYG